MEKRNIFGMAFRNLQRPGNLTQVVIRLFFKFTFNAHLSRTVMNKPFVNFNSDAFLSLDLSLS